MDDEMFPTEFSEKGDNTYTHVCEVYGGSRHYAVCLNVIKRVRANDPDRNAYDTACRKAIDEGENGSCPALAMRRREILVGKTLYYVPRVKAGLPPIPPAQIFEPSYERGFRGPEVGRRVPPRIDPMQTQRLAVKPSAKPTPKSKPLDTSNLHAELVNKLMEEGK